MKWKSQEKININIHGPAFHAENTPTEVSCDFTDELEALSVNAYSVKVTYGPSAAEARNCFGQIKDFVTEDKVEYMVMTDGTKIRLDMIRSIANQ